MHIDDIVKTLVQQGLSEDAIRYNVEQMVQNMVIYECNPGMYTLS